MELAKASKSQNVEPLVKEEGEMSDTEEVHGQFKEVKWREWCEDVMVDEEKTLKHLQKLHTTSADIPKEKELHLAGVGPSHNHGSVTGDQTYRCIDEENFEAWKRRSEADASRAPSDNRQFGNGRPFRVHQASFPQDMVFPQDSSAIAFEVEELMTIAKSSQDLFEISSEDNNFASK
ncbi:hypothetical protein ACH5RR_009302 [Cinchona calisaya]|uniref:Uncharacterized protein n=1 Tax=Cinchona calisaya TaxID=153742 RepID=A0ABD3AHE1_9GENT